MSRTSTRREGESTLSGRESEEGPDVYLNRQGCRGRGCYAYSQGHAGRTRTQEGNIFGGESEEGPVCVSSHGRALMNITQRYCGVLGSHA